MTLTLFCPIFSWNLFEVQMASVKFLLNQLSKYLYSPVILLHGLTANNINKHFPPCLGTMGFGNISPKHQWHSKHRKYVKLRELNLSYQTQWTQLHRSNVLHLHLSSHLLERKKKYMCVYIYKKLRISTSISTPKISKPWKSKYLTFKRKHEEGSLATACKLVETLLTAFTRAISITAG